ncbi:DUF6503 family protein [Neotamlana laminarinivorans]|uniref:Deoxyribose-phosphate aldolase n=1 Tax=Neotamlana laminarinivorans TaxID=2883124 RepID=A0A9X1HW88_9FLAO|nr:DUF6503 family protein [Tamlana laminarinivorans]MCB4797318.1 deoxyribose-phosphate aldolase [Tamlana laminarinivorans]
MPYKNIIILIFTCLAFSCKTEQPNANEIINTSILKSGGETLKNAVLDFDFRDKHYKAKRAGGKFEFQRVFSDSIGVVKDVLNNSSFKRYINDTLVDVDKKKADAYTSSVNSVHYFSVLPYGLNDKAVNKTFLAEVEVKGKTYYKIKVTFNEEGGGEDFDDEFIYWINKNTFFVDYLAYSYAEATGRGYRFREAYNERFLNGVRMVDYNNYKPKENDITLGNLDLLFEKGELTLLSKIELEAVKVSPI